MRKHREFSQGWLNFGLALMVLGAVLQLVAVMLRVWACR